MVPRYTFSSVLIFLTLIFGLGSVTAGEDTTPIVIGVIHSTTYPSAESMKRSFEMATTAVNEKGGVKGRPLQLVYADDGLKASGSIGYQHGDEKQAVESLLKRGAVMLVGGYSSANTIHTAHVAEKFDIPFLVTTAADDQITQRRLKNVYRLNMPAREYAGGLERLLAKNVQPKSMAIVYEASPYGTGAAARMLAFCRDNNVRPCKLIPYQKDRVDAAYLEKRLRRIQKRPPDVVYMASYLDDAVLLVNTLRKLNVDSWLIGAGGGFTNPRFIDMLGDSSDKILTAALWSSHLPYEGAQAYHDAYAARFSEMPDYHGAEAYSSVLVAADALQRAEALGPEGIRQSLDSTDLETPFGQVRFRAYDRFERQNSAPTVVFQIIGAKYELVWPEDIATAGLLAPEATTVIGLRN